MSTLFADERCSHGVSYTQRCDDCLQVGLARASGELRHSCHVTYEIDGKACPQPGRTSASGCSGCVYFVGNDGNQPQR